MEIDSINISTYGLELISFDKYYGQPSRKKIHEENHFEQKDIVFEYKEPSITLLGIYQSIVEMENKIKAFMDHIRSSVKHDYILNEHGESFTGVIRNGIKVETTRAVAELKFKIIIVE